MEWMVAAIVAASNAGQEWCRSLPPFPNEAEESVRSDAKGAVSQPA